jgi:hypothetical protein
VPIPDADYVALSVNCCNARLLFHTSLQIKAVEGHPAHLRGTAGQPSRVETNFRIFMTEFRVCENFHFRECLREIHPHVKKKFKLCKNSKFILELLRAFASALNTFSQKYFAKT